MRTVPTQVTDGFTNHYTAFWVVKVEPSTGDPYYWTTTSKNRTGNTFTLKWDSSTTVTPDSGMIAHRDWATGEEYSGIGEMESGVDIHSGGGVATVSDLEIQVLNQESFHNTVIQANINIENRPVSIWFGFIPDGAAQTVIVSTEMLKRWSGVVEEVMDYNYQTFVLRCVDGSFQRHKEIPVDLITATDFPNAPKENIGKPLPIVYGAFYVNESNERDTETVSPAPTVKTDDIAQVFHVSGHALHTFGSHFHYSPENGLFGLLTAATETNAAAGASFTWAAGTTIVATFRQLPKVDTGDTTAADFDNAVDSSLTSYAALDPSELWYAFLPPPKEIGELVDSTGGSAFATLRATFGTISNTTTARIRYYDTSTDAATAADITDSDSDTTVEKTTPTSLTWANLQKYKWGITVTSVTGLVQLKNFCIEYYVKLYQLGTLLPSAAMIGIGTRPRTFGRGTY